MTKLTALLLSATVALSACQMATDTASPSAVTPLVGKRLVSQQGDVFRFDADGSVGGTFRGEPIVGTYAADGPEVCSTYSAPKQLAGKEFCSTPQIDGTTVAFKRRDGSTSQAYTIGG